MIFKSRKFLQFHDAFIDRRESVFEAVKRSDFVNLNQLLKHNGYKDKYGLKRKRLPISTVDLEHALTLIGKEDAKANRIKELLEYELNYLNNVLEQKEEQAANHLFLYRIAMITGAVLIGLAPVPICFILPFLSMILMPFACFAVIALCATAFDEHFEKGIFKEISISHNKDLDNIVNKYIPELKEPGAAPANHGSAPMVFDAPRTMGTGLQSEVALSAADQPGQIRSTI